MAKEWPCELPAVQLRIARPTGQLDSAVRFYRDGLGLPVIYSYMDDADYDGVIFGLPGRHYNLEITRHRDDGPCPAPPPDNLLVFYVLDRAAVERVTDRLRTMGYRPVAPRNPYWAERGMTFTDPDGWRVVLMNTHGFGTDIE